MSKLGFASVAAVNQYLRLAHQMKLDINDALAQSDVGSTKLSDPTERITGEQFQIILKNLIQQAKDPLFGLNSGKFVQPGSYNILGYITMNCASVGDAIMRVASYEKLVGDMGVSTINKDQGLIHLNWHCRYTDPDVRPHMMDNVLASWITYARWLANTESPPIEVRFEHPLEDKTLYKYYEDLFRCPVLFDQPKTAVIVDNRLFNYPLRQPDPTLLRTLEDHADTLMAEFKQAMSLVPQIKNALRVAIKTGFPNKNDIADRFNMTPRTLQRRLGQENVSYQQLLNEVRLELAEDYLRNTSLSLHDIAQKLGFSEPRSFHRSFKNWTGKTPGEYRNR